VDSEHFPHATTGYSLQGHQETAEGSSFTCEECHGSDLSAFDPAQCASCHRDLDAAFLRDHNEAFGTDCLACHDGIDTYGQQFDHDQLAFPLLGQHAAIPCVDCHSEALSLAALQSTPRDCYTCHQADDAHQGQFGTDCAACHTPDDWQQATFDHAQTAFPLLGRHADIACQDCHVNSLYQGTPQDCYACHQADDAHDGQYGTDCAACHTPDDWQQATFDHAQTAFPLLGQHAGIACQDCHVDGLYQGTPQDCHACHEDPVFHLGLFGQDCAECHSAEGWMPAQYGRTHIFPISHGERGPNSCRTCHPNDLQTYDCYGCHEHEPAEIEREHREEGITDFEDCVDCHATGEEDEGEEGD